MRRSSVIVVGMLIAIGIGLTAVAGDLDQAIAGTNAKVDKVAAQCVKQLNKVGTATAMDQVAAQCEARILNELAALEAQAEEAGVELDVTFSDVCVYREDLDHEACFDPIHVN